MSFRSVCLRNCRCLKGRSPSWLVLRLLGEVGGTGAGVNLGPCEAEPAVWGVLDRRVRLITLFRRPVSRSLYTLENFLPMAGCDDGALGPAAEEDDPLCPLCLRNTEGRRILSLSKKEAGKYEDGRPCGGSSSVMLAAVSSRESLRSVASGSTPRLASEARGVRSCS